MRNGRRAAFAFREHGVAVAHEQDGFLVGARVVEADVDGVAEAVVRLAGRQQTMRGEEVDEALADRVDAGLVVAAAVDVHRVAQQVQHRLLLRGQPVGDLRFVWRELGHGRAPAVS